jgi:hypothetical protein
LKTSSKDSLKTLRLVARIMSAIIVGFALLMFIGESMGSRTRGTSEPMTIKAIIGLSLADMGLLGLALAWIWEMAGGIICAVSFIVLFIINANAMLMPMLIFPANAALFIAVAYLSKKS